MRKLNTEQIHKGPYYEAFTLRGGLIVHKRGSTRGGKYLTGPQAGQWIEAIKKALDSAEADFLCKGVLS